MKRKFLNPKEVEKIFNEARKNDKQFTKSELNAVQVMVETAKRNGRIGDKVTVVIPPHWIHIPTWQRTANIDNAMVIGSNYNRYKWDAPKVLYNGKYLIVIDGMHRLLGVLLRNMKNPDNQMHIVVELMDDITEEEAIELFLAQTNDRHAMRPKDYYKAAVKANKENYVRFSQICHSHNVQVVGDDTLKNPIGVFTSISDGIKTDPEVLTKIMNLIAKLKWNGKETGKLNPSSAAYSCKTIRSIKKLYAYYSNNEKEMEEILLKKCKGSEWFVRYLSDMPQYAIFDRLNEVVERELLKSASTSNSTSESELLDNTNISENMSALIKDTKNKMEEVKNTVEKIVEENKASEKAMEDKKVSKKKAAKKVSETKKEKQTQTLQSQQNKQSQESKFNKESQEEMKNQNVKEESAKQESAKQEETKAVNE